MGWVVGLLLGVILVLIAAMMAIAWAAGGWIGLSVTLPLPVIVLGFVWSEWRSFRPVVRNPWLSDRALKMQARMIAEDPFIVGTRITQVVRDDASRPGGPGARSVLGAGDPDLFPHGEGELFEAEG
jgi:hypothetical protein